MICRALPGDENGDLFGEHLAGPASILLGSDVVADAILVASGGTFRAAGVDARHVAELCRPWLAPNSTTCPVASGSNALGRAIRLARDGAPA